MKKNFFLHYLISNTPLGALVLFFFAACVATTIDNKYIVSPSVLTVSDTSSTKVILDEEHYPITDIYYNSIRANDSIIIFDKMANRFTIYNGDGKIFKVISKGYQDFFEETPTSINYNKNSEHLLYLKRGKVLKINKNKNVTTIDLDKVENEIQLTDIYGFKVLNNGNILVPHGVNYLIFADLYKKHIKGNLLKAVKNQYIFSLYSSDGKLIKQFGKFPTDNLIENPNHSGPQHFFFETKGDFMFLTFPYGNTVYKYDLMGNEITSFSIELPGVNYNVVPNKIENDRLIGFGMDFSADTDVFFFHTFQHINSRKKIQYIFKYDFAKNTLTQIPVPGGNNFMLSRIYNNEIWLLKIYFDNETKELIKMKIDK